MTSNPRDSASELAARAATQRGETGDKIPGFDPAAAPMETDAEAGGVSHGGAAPAGRAGQNRPSGTSTGAAMRPMMKGRGGRKVAVVAIASLLCILAVAALIGLGE